MVLRLPAPRLSHWPAQGLNLPALAWGATATVAVTTTTAATLTIGTASMTAATSSLTSSSGAGIVIVRVRVCKAQ